MFEQYEDILTVDELCEALHIGHNQAYRMLAQKVIKGMKIGRTWKIPKASLISYMCEQCQLEKM